MKNKKQILILTAFLTSVCLCMADSSAQMSTGIDSVSKTILQAAAAKNETAYFNLKNHPFEENSPSKIREKLHYFLLNGISETTKKKMCLALDQEAWKKIEMKRICIEHAQEINDFMAQINANSLAEHADQMTEFTRKIYLKAEKRPIDKSKIKPCFFEKDNALINSEIREVCIYYLREFGNEETLKVIEKILKQPLEKTKDGYPPKWLFFDLYFRLTGNVLNNFLMEFGMDATVPFEAREKLYDQIKALFYQGIRPHFFPPVDRDRVKKIEEDIRQSYINYMRKVVKKKKLFPSPPDFAPDYETREYRNWKWFVDHPDIMNPPQKPRSSLMQSIKNKDMPRLTDALEKGADANKRNNSGHLPLGVAIGTGFFNAAPVLLKFGADVNGQSLPLGKTGLHSAVQQGNLDIAALLIKHGADVNIETTQGVTPLDMAVGFRDKEMATLLRKHGAKHKTSDWKPSEYSAWSDEKRKRVMQQRK